MTKTLTGPTPLNVTLKPIPIGEDYRFTLRIKDDNGNVTDTTDWDMDIIFRENNKNGETVFTLGVGSGITHTPGIGRFDVHITDTQTLLIDVSRLAWDMKLTDADGLIWYPMEGVVQVKETVTK